MSYTTFPISEEKCRRPINTVRDLDDLDLGRFGLEWLCTGRVGSERTAAAVKVQNGTALMDCAVDPGSFRRFNTHFYEFAPNVILKFSFDRDGSVRYQFSYHLYDETPCSKLLSFCKFMTKRGIPAVVDSGFICEYLGVDAGSAKKIHAILFKDIEVVKQSEDSVDTEKVLILPVVTEVSTSPVVVPVSVPESLHGLPKLVDYERSRSEYEWPKSKVASLPDGRTLKYGVADNRAFDLGDIKLTIGVSTGDIIKCFVNKDGSVEIFAFRPGMGGKQEVTEEELGFVIAFFGSLIDRHPRVVARKDSVLAAARAV